MVKRMNSTEVAQYALNQTTNFAVNQVQNGVPIWVVLLALVGAIAIFYSAVTRLGHLFTYIIIPIMAFIYLIYKWRKNKKVVRKH